MAYLKKNERWKCKWCGRPLMTTKSRTYTEEEVDKIIETCMSAKIGVEDFIKTGIIKCPHCAKPFLKTDKYSWKLTTLLLTL